MRQVWGRRETVANSICMIDVCMLTRILGREF